MTDAALRGRNLRTPGRRHRRESVYADGSKRTAAPSRRIPSHDVFAVARRAAATADDTDYPDLPRPPEEIRLWLRPHDPARCSTCAEAWKCRRG